MRASNLGFICGLLLCVGSVQSVAQPHDTQEYEQLRQFLQQSIADSESFEDRFDAEVWLLDMSNRLQQYVKDPEQRLQLLQEVHRYASQSQLPPELVLAVIEVESHFDRFAVSRVGAQGMMQVMPFWKDEIGRPEDNLTLTSTNLSYGCRILQFYIKREKGNLTRALAAYNGSLGSTRYSDKVEAAWRRNWRGPNLDWE
ncbi:lytic transglycosylase domain-containing protein [Halieaceae bacterium IMCC14734]|uniref:Lytic transglycosylase domain-containing protein n=1 Tax=Candidatus Litorirhabdus singularis TaxID=2518993 RepID=A0ABT3TCY6_9GAMM|nr:transglycosylase SLT domain-containing protein [Candidatus Litorirhabdus singularis]MCX2979337.1 lytic transglycosylase domain-containing protein [Candidatus Litorirhabdus singularis]